MHCYSPFAYTAYIYSYIFIDTRKLLKMEIFVYDKVNIMRQYFVEIFSLNII